MAALRIIIIFLKGLVIASLRIGTNGLY